MLFCLDMPEWVARDLQRYLEEEIRTVSDQCLSRADLYRAERQRRTLGLVVGQIETRLLDVERRFEESLLEARKAAAPDGGAS